MSHVLNTFPPYHFVVNITETGETYQLLKLEEPVENPDILLFQFGCGNYTLNYGVSGPDHNYLIHFEIQNRIIESPH